MTLPTGSTGHRRSTHCAGLRRDDLRWMAEPCACSQRKISDAVAPAQVEISVYMQKESMRTAFAPVFFILCFSYSPVFCRWCPVWDPTVCETAKEECCLWPPKYISPGNRTHPGHSQPPGPCSQCPRATTSHSQGHSKSVTLYDIKDQSESTLLTKYVVAFREFDSSSQ